MRPAVDVGLEGSRLQPIVAIERVEEILRRIIEIVLITAKDFHIWFGVGRQLEISLTYGAGLVLAAEITRTEQDRERTFARDR